MISLIRCPECKKAIKDSDVVTLDFINTVRHLVCLGVHIDLIETIDEFMNIKKKYAFLK